MLTPGTAAPPFELADNNGRTVRLSDFAGSWVFLWWYPEADSSGCSIQAASLGRATAAIEEAGVRILGASFNTVDRNDQFACNKSLDFPLLSDPDMTAGKAYDVVRDPDEPYADKPRRVSYLIDPKGTIAAAEDVDHDWLPTYGEHVLELVREHLRTAE